MQIPQAQQTSCRFTLSPSCPPPRLISPARARFPCPCSCALPLAPFFLEPKHLSISYGCSLTRSAGGAAAKQEAPAATQEPGLRMQPRATGSSKKKHRGPSYFAGRPLPPGRESLEGLQGYKKCSFWSDSVAPVCMSMYAYVCILSLSCSL